MKVGTVKVNLEYAPTEEGEEFNEWCKKHGFVPMGSTRRAWCSQYQSYFRGALGVAHTVNGESFLFYEEDLAE